MAKGQSQKPHSGKMDKDNKDDKDGLFGGRFHFKKLPNDSLEKKKSVTFTFCKAEFMYYRSYLSGAYHLRAKHLLNPPPLGLASPRCRTVVLEGK